MGKLRALLHRERRQAMRRRIADLEDEQAKARAERRGMLRRIQFWERAAGLADSVPPALALAVERAAPDGTALLLPTPAGDVIAVIDSGVVSAADIWAELSGAHGRAEAAS